MVLQNIDLPNYQAFKRLVEMKMINGRIPKTELEQIAHLASEHGICKDDVEELVDLLEIKKAG